MQISDFGEEGWAHLCSSLILSDKLELWLPNGEELKSAYKNKKTLINEIDLIDLIERGLIRVGGRPYNFGIGAGALHKVDESELGRYLSNLIIDDQSANEHKLLLHQDNDSAKKSLNSILNRRIDDLFYLRAQLLVAEHMGSSDGSVRGVDRVPQIVFDRAEFFLSQDTSDIKNLQIRECFKAINSVSDKMERYRLAVISQLIRLAFDHEYLMKNHGSDTHFALKNYASTFQQVVGSPGVLQSMSEREYVRVEDIQHIIEDLLSFAGQDVVNSKMLADRHEKLRNCRSAMWRLIHSRDNVEDYICERLRDYLEQCSLSAQFFGTTDRVLGLEARLSLGAAATKIVSFVIDYAVNPLAYVTAPFKVVAVSRRFAKARSKLLFSDNAWPAILVYGRERPSREEVYAVLRDIKHMARARGG
ncbi:MAG: hypothetical protein ACTS3R_08255 [Inquilinaceae bacterium]